MAFGKQGKNDNRKESSPEMLLALDIGSYRIRLIEGCAGENHEVKVSYYNEVPSSGMTGSTVTDMSELSEALSSLIKSYEEDTGRRFSHCIVNIAGVHIRSLNDVGETTVPTHTVTESDRKNALQHASAVKIGDYMRTIHAIPRGYTTDTVRESDDGDGELSITNPVGMSAMRLKAGVHLIGCNEDQESNLKTAIASVTADARVDLVAYSGLVAADAVLSREDKEIGVCVIDIGAGSTNVTLYHDNKLLMTCGINKGGAAITKAIAQKFSVSLQTADSLKTKYGVAHQDFLPANAPTLKICPPHPADSEDNIEISSAQLAETISFQLSDIFMMVQKRIDQCIEKNSEEKVALGAGFVFTGGTALLNQIVQLAGLTLAQNNRPLMTRARVGLPKGVGFTEDFIRTAASDGVSLNSPEFATVTGLLRFGLMKRKEDNDLKFLNAERRRQSGGLFKIYRVVRDWMSQEL